MQIVLISGLSGSGKSIALNVLEDAGYYVVDNLPAALLPQLVAHLRGAGWRRVAVAVDMRSGVSIAALPQQVEALRATVRDLRMIFLEARDDALIARFSETRRRHPLAIDDVTLEEAIQRERDALESIAELGHRIDTSDLHPNTLRAWVKDFIQMPSTEGMTLMFESFGFKYGIPLDADLVFDVRCLPNPYWKPELREHSGLDQPVIDYLAAQPDVEDMFNDISSYLLKWLPRFAASNRAYVTIAIGCTGGHHRSVYLTERLGQVLQQSLKNVQVRHRDL